MPRVLSYWWRLFWREHILTFLLMIALSGLGISYFLASTLILETETARIIFMAFFLRSFLILVVLCLVPFYMIRLHQTHEIFHFLTQSYSRASFLLQTWCSFTLLLLVFCVFASFALIMSRASHVFVLQWNVSLFCESLIMMSFCLFLACRLSHPAFTSIIGLLFYGLGRTHDLMTATFATMPQFQWFFKMFPAFDHFTQTQWLMSPALLSTFSSLVVETALFTLFFATLAILTYQKRWL